MDAKEDPEVAVACVLTDDPIQTLRLVFRSERQPKGCLFSFMGASRRVKGQIAGFLSRDW